MRITDYSELPYGAYLGRNSVTWFDRRYRPIVSAPWYFYDPDERVIFAGELTPVEPDRWIDFERQAWIYSDPTFDRKTRTRLRQIVESLPTLKAELVRRGAVRA